MGSTGRLLLPLLLLLLLSTPPPAAAKRRRRGLLQLAGAIQCSTGRTPLAYIRYGCYCGLGGSGWPRDPVDWCCFNHDCCYEKAEKAGCSPKMQTYTWECENNRAKCEDIEDKCQKLACECDRRAAKCLSKSPYNATLLFCPENQCGTHSPQCEDD